MSLLDGMHSLMLSRLLFCAGHVAQCQVVHCELNIVRERKKRVQTREHATDKVSAVYYQVRIKQINDVNTGSSRRTGYRRR